LGLFIALGLEWLAIPRLTSATTRDEAVTWLSVMAPVRVIGGASLGLVLLPGLYMAGTRWGFGGWPGVALGGLILMALIGGLLTGRTTAGLGSRVAAEQDSLSAGFLERLRSPALVRSLWMRGGLALGIVALMVFKPDAVTSSIVLVAAIGLGFVISVLGAHRAAVAAPKASALA
jgi:hypothetical protein